MHDMSASPGDHEFIVAMGPVARELLGEPTENNRAKRELRFGTRGSLSISLDKGTFYDHEAGRGRRCYRSPPEASQPRQR